MAHVTLRSHIPSFASHIAKTSTDAFNGRLATRTLVRAVYCILACLTIFTAGFQAWSRSTAWDSELAHSRAATENIAHAASEHADATLSTIQGLLDGMVERIETDGVEGAAGQRLHHYLASRLDTHPALHGLFVLDRNGRGVVSSLRGENPPLNNADRPYFIHHRLDPSQRTHLGRPIVSRSTGEWIITLSRRVNDRNGNFAGIALATIPVRYFQQYYERFSIGRQGAVLLAFTSGTVVTRLPAGTNVTGSEIRHTEIFRHVDATGAPSGTVMLMTNFDRLERQHSYRRVPDFPLLVVAARAKDEIMEDWWTVTWQENAVIICMLSVVYGAGFWLIAQFRLRERLQNALLQTQRALEARNAELDRQARTDALTGLHNRRHFDETLSLELARAARTGTQVSLVMLDVDFFKRFNDEYGHAAGDDCLQMIGSVLNKAAARPGDFAARLGGEEFAILLPDTGTSGALAVAELARNAVLMQRMTHHGHPLGIVTVSVGVATDIPHERAGADGRVLLEAADKALYRAKADGRNCVRAAN